VSASSCKNSRSGDVFECPLFGFADDQKRLHRVVSSNSPLISDQVKTFELKDAEEVLTGPRWLLALWLPGFESRKQAPRRRCNHGYSA